jgi:hypothetical protein
MGAAGENGDDLSFAGDGGIGFTSATLTAFGDATSTGQLVGSDRYYAGGGGGGYLNSDVNSGAGGSGGGGAGKSGNAVSGTANTGGGGGGTGSAATPFTGGNGGSGVVIVRYAV